MHKTNTNKDDYKLGDNKTNENTIKVDILNIISKIENINENMNNCCNKQADINFDEIKELGSENPNYPFNIDDYNFDKMNWEISEIDSVNSLKFEDI